MDPMILITLQGHIKELHKLHRNFQNTDMSFNINYTTSEVCPLLGFYVVKGGNSVLMFQDNLSVPSSKGQEVQVSNHEIHSQPILENTWPLGS
jgi:hypothetical protein